MHMASPIAANKTPPPKLDATKANGPQAPGTPSSILGTATNVARDVGTTLAQHAMGEAQKMVHDGAGKMVHSVITSSMLSPIRMFASSLLGSLSAPIIQGFISKLAPSLEKYLQSKGVPLPNGLSATDVMTKCIYGSQTEVEELGSQMIGHVTGMLMQTLPKDLQDALNSGNPIAIASAATKGAWSGAKSITNQVSQEQSRIGFLGKPFVWLGKKIPLINKLPASVQPWAAGGGIVVFGGLAMRMAFKAVKWVVLLGAGALGLSFLAKFMGGKKAVS